MSHVDEGTLHAYLDGELPSSERTVLETHLAHCDACRSRLAEERALLDRASALLGSARPADRPVPPFEQLPRTPKRSPWYVRRSVAWAASIALALGIGYYLNQPAGRPSPAPTSGLNETRAISQRDEMKPAAPTANAFRRSAKRETPPPSGEAQPAEKRQPARADSAGPLIAIDGARLDTARPARDSVASVARQRGVDSTARLEAVVVTGQAAQERAPAPTVAAPTNRASRITELRGRAVTTQWPIISRGVARSLLGSEPVGLPGLATRGIRRSPAADGTVVVEQQIDSATTIEIFQRVAVADQGYTKRFDRSRATGAAAADRLARYVGTLRVEIAGPLSVDSLNRLLDQVQPLP